jgi:glycosyltransferase involved in cell wall biosynthesis
MKVLFISALLPYPLFSGGQVRMYNLLQRLSRTHEITLCSYIRKSGERANLDKLGFVRDIRTVLRGRALNPAYLFRAATSSYPWLLASYDLASMRATVSRELATGTYDLVHIEPFYVMPGLPKTDLPVVVSEHNIEYDVYRRYADAAGLTMKPMMLWDVEKLRRMERKSWQMASQTIAVSEDDAAVIKRYTDKVTVVPNGVDTHWFHFRDRTVTDAPRCLFVGNFSWGPNRDALEYLVMEVWPVLKKRIPKAELTVVGKGAPADLVSSDGVRYLSDVDDIRTAMDNADVSLAPMRIPGGSKYKIIESMAAGLPVVTTPEGVAGLNAKDGTHVMLASTPNEISAALVSAASRPAAIGKMAHCARRLVESTYDWEAIAKIQDRVWKEAV